MIRFVSPLHILGFAVVFAGSLDCSAQSDLLPLGRTAYFAGEQVPLALGGTGPVKLEAVGPGGRTLLYQGQAVPVLLDTSYLAPGDYTLELDGKRVAERFSVTAVQRRSPASLQDESLPDAAMPSDEVARAINESGLTAAIGWDMANAGTIRQLDDFARAGVILLSNPDTRPTSFNPGTLEPAELDGMRQRIALTAQANARYPNFGGFAFAWDTTGFNIGGRNQLLVYWQWGEQTEALKRYIAKVDRFKMDEFQRRTGLEAVSESDYLAYLLAIGRGDLASTVACDLPSKLWIEELAAHGKKMSPEDVAAFEQRLDAWGDYQMSQYGEVYSAYSAALKDIVPGLRHTGSIQIDHNTTRAGQYFPKAYAPLDLMYQSTWNDQVGGPDYQYQWLITQGLLNMHRQGRPTWISSASGLVHDRARWPGKLTRVAAHGLAYGGSGIGFALEGFSNLLTGMNSHSRWNAIKGKEGEAEVAAAREFLDRFASLALGSTNGHGVGVLFSKTQFGRQNMIPAFGSPPFETFVTLARLGYTPRFVTEEEIAAGKAGDVKALVVLGQTVPLPKAVTNGLAALAHAGTRIIVDNTTEVSLPRAEKLGHAFGIVIPGKPHSWSAPNMVPGDNDALMMGRVHQRLAPIFLQALGDIGRAPLVPEAGAASDLSVFRMEGGEATYLTVVNDSYIGTQADWYQVKEQLVPAKGATGQLYDLVNEQSLGALAPLNADLSATTARVLAILPRALKRIDLAATQQISVGEDLVMRVGFTDETGRVLAAVLPFQINIHGPDGKTWQSFYRATDAAGKFSMGLPMPLNVPAGNWTVSVRSQLNGQVAALPVTVTAAKAAPLATPFKEPVVVRNRAAIEAAFAKDTTIVIPVFASPHADELAKIAEQAKAVLAGRGVRAEILRDPPVGSYTLAYELSHEQEAENAAVDRGEKLGRLAVKTSNGNDWFSSKSTWRYGKNVLLIDLAVEPGDNPMAEALDNRNASFSLLWPEVSAIFPGPGKAVVEAVPWAFGPDKTAVVIRARDLAGLAAGVKALAHLPADHLTPGIVAAREQLWREHWVGGKPAQPDAAKASNHGLTTAQMPQPFAISFPGAKPPVKAAVRHPEPPVHPMLALPCVVEPRQYILQYRINGQWIETDTVEFLKPDLRFSEAILLATEVKHSGKLRITANGVFRYSDRMPRWQPQWDDLLKLREKLVPKERRPMVVEVFINEQPVGQLVPAKTEQKEVDLETFVSSPKKTVEEMVTRLVGEVELPAGRQELRLVPRNIVDGNMQKIGLGVEP